MRSSRRPFLLLETLIALAMIGICSGFFLATPTKIYHKHLEDLQSIELARASKNIFIQIQHSLKQNHPWDTLKKDSTNIFSLHDFPIQCGSLIQNTYKVGYKLWVKKEKEGDDGSIYKLIECRIYFASESGFTSWEKTFSKKNQPLYFSYKIFISFSPKIKAIL
ncbi:MAG: hypothetical protein WCG10_02125 [Chlamydiota bacterium]